MKAIRDTAHEQVPFNVQGVSHNFIVQRLWANPPPQYLDEFSKSLATEVRMLLNEVGKLREEKRNIQQYVSLP